MAEDVTRYGNLRFGPTCVTCDSFVTPVALAASTYGEAIELSPTSSLNSTCSSSYRYPLLTGINMSHVELRVELPAYSHSFVIQVPLSSTILDVKQEILRSCIGAPRPDGQKIVWRGRFLVDHEKVQDLWKVRFYGICRFLLAA